MSRRDELFKTTEFARKELSKRERKLKKMREAAEKQKQEQEAREEAAHRARTIAYIEKETRTAAVEGKYYYVYEFGEKPPELAFRDLLVEHFKDLSPRIIFLDRTAVVNYDTGTDREYRVFAMQFNWGK
jgi:hypothetical protein